MTTRSDLVETSSTFRGIADHLLSVLHGRRALAALGLAIVAVGLTWQWT